MQTKLKYSILILMAVLLILPFQGVQAKGLSDGPIIGTNYTLKSGDSLNQDLVVFGGSVAIETDAKVNGALVMFGGSLTLDGEVTGDTVVLGGAVKLGSKAHIHGNLVTFGTAVSREVGAKVDGDTITNPTSPSMPSSPGMPSVPGVTSPANNNPNPFWRGLVILVQSIMLGLLAVLIAMFLPNHMRRVADAVVTQPLVAFGMGLLTVIMFIVAIVALAIFSIFIITLIVTIPLIVIVSIAFAAASVLGWLALGMEVGIRIPTLFKSEWPLPLAAGVGVFILNLVAQSVSFIPCIGGLLAGILGIAGLGAVFITRFGIRPGTPALPAVVNVEPPAQQV